jgi:ribose-phosphate pyrophosphokinase
MKPSAFVLDAAGGLGDGVAARLGYRVERVAPHEFPDGETAVRVDPHAVTETVLVAASLDHPNVRILPLLLLAETLHDYGARRLVLLAPYLAYMRQDRRFKPGQGISARYFARLLSGYFDALVTVDPHLHRIPSLDEIYSIPTRVVHAAPAVAEWIRQTVEKPLLIGPDSESGQWVGDLARRAGCPFIVLNKIRRGDRRVEVSIPEVEQWLRHTPVLYDDMISTGRTMLETVSHLQAAGMAPPVCIAVHGLFAGEAYRSLLEAGAARVVTTNTVRHESNRIDLTLPVSDAVQALLHQ